ncbi:hypothetical protein SIAM614_02696 [Stappia aggregata IAM 12614]|uniref:Uncharacterized protein n=1 Tax=Roseibium aggregatum (strain ATCC 25650 / DSM 13394 / JCM 20685 / NBRC 16684 / NCIMB 2208 / IAM 12614 / B1) TaxID=384765 RepID=A0NUE8_ROSAI|nr:hypothetical protein SIAM614_02696 [Stappia aggregata IAM 12614] [Roseibium aggregatum IAM 12614]
MQTGPERRPLRERLSESIEQAHQEEQQAHQDQNASLLEAYQISVTNIGRMLKAACNTMNNDFQAYQRQVDATLDRHLKESAQQLFQLKISLEQNKRLAAKNRLLKLSAAILLSAGLTLGGVLFLNNQLRWALITSAFNQTTYTDFPILIFDTKTGTYERCRDIDGKLSCQPTE